MIFGVILNIYDEIFHLMQTNNYILFYIYATNLLVVPF